MPAALPFIGAGLSAYSAIKGAQQQGQANRINQQQLAQLQHNQVAQDQIRQMVLGRLGQSHGAVGNPFSAAYGPITPPSAPAAAPAPAPMPRLPPNADPRLLTALNR